MYVCPCDLEAESKQCSKGGQIKSFGFQKKKRSFLGGALGRLPGGDGI